MTDDERGEYEDVILNLRRIIKAWETEEIIYQRDLLNFDGFLYWVNGESYSRPAEAYAALEKDGE